MGGESHQETEDRIQKFIVKYKETYKCLGCGKKVRFWPFIVNNNCPYCGKSILRQLMDAGTISLECKNCGTPINSMDMFMTNYYTKCYGSPGGIPFAFEAYNEAKDLSPHKVYEVKCDMCGRKVETREVEYGGTFPLAGYCGKCTKTVCWNCAKMIYASGVWETNEFVAFARAGNMMVLRDSSGQTMAPKCPNCDIYLGAIVNLPAESTFHLLKTRIVNPLE